MKSRPRNRLVALVRTLAVLATGGIRSAVTLSQIYQQQRYPGSNAYPSTDPRRTILDGWRPAPTTPWQLTWDLSQLIAQGRHLDRTTPVFRGLVEGRKAELVGTGIACEPDTGDPRINRLLKSRIDHWLATIGTNEESIWTLQRMASGDIDTAGSFLWRWVDLPDRLEKGQCPHCLLPLEAEWLSEIPVEAIPDNHTFVRGVLLDHHGRTVAVDLVNPDNFGSIGEGERVPIDQIILGFERRRARQALGEPRLVTLIERTLQDDEMVVSELKAARNAQATSMIIRSDELVPRVPGGREGRGDPIAPETIPVGSIAYVPRDTEIFAHQHNRPSASVREFRQTIRGDMAAGGQVSRVWTDRDGSAYNFANSKFDQIRTQQMVKPAHDWFGTLVATKVYEALVPWAMLAEGLDWPTDPLEQRRLCKHKLIPDVPPELDESSAVKGFEDGFRNRVTSRETFIGTRGRDAAEVSQQIDKELTADGLAAIERAKTLQAACEKANAASPGLNLHWTQVVPKMLDASDPDMTTDPIPAPPDPKNAA